METRRILIVANQTAPGPHLAEIVRSRVEEGPCTFLLLVPSVVPKLGLGMTWTEGQAEAAARKRMEVALAGLRSVGADIDGRVEDATPMQAVAIVMTAEDRAHHQPFDEVILSTLPPGVSRWLKHDLPHRIAKRWQIPVTHVIGEGEPVTV